MGLPLIFKVEASFSGSDGCVCVRREVAYDTTSRYGNRFLYIVVFIKMTGPTKCWQAIGRLRYLEVEEAGRLLQGTVILFMNGYVGDSVNGKTLSHPNRSSRRNSPAK